MRLRPSLAHTAGHRLADSSKIGSIIGCIKEEPIRDTLNNLGGLYISASDIPYYISPKVFLTLIIDLGF